MSNRWRLLTIDFLSCFGNRDDVSNQRRLIDRSAIGEPTGFRHTGHIGSDSAAIVDFSSIDQQQQQQFSQADSSSGVPASSRFIDLAVLREQNFELAKLSAYFRGPSSASAAADAVPKEPGDADSDSGPDAAVAEASTAADVTAAYLAASMSRPSPAAAATAAAL
ncbi:hypothetical protein BOX15_Mlig010593g3 [Macrostomum lignano]|uniref:CRIB domain-containing protein n=1 Tax=Macrostomum lignano TaxID=282301 RepID=A0A267ESB6_9PLAT|nr:hypothetical protein BOX15_Mlig010593g3 [Macrostomum lignano]